MLQLLVFWAACLAPPLATAYKLVNNRARSFLSTTRTDVGAPDEIHIAYQMPCERWSLHQAIALDWSWKNVKQPGKLTRIVCGCSPEHEKQFHSSVLSDDPRFNVYFTKDWNQEVPRLFAQVADDHYHAYNHPFGFADWFEHAKPEEFYVMYMEPDMFFTAPILNHVAGHAKPAARGHPLGEFYGYVTANGDPSTPGWAEMAPTVCGSECATLIETRKSSSSESRHYAVGPPTVMHRDDWAAMLPLWRNYSVEMRAHAKVRHATWQKVGEPTYIAEMLGYSLASAVQNLPHEIEQWTVDGSKPCMNCSPSLVHNCFKLELTSGPNNGWDFNKYRPPFGYMAGEQQWDKTLFMDCTMPLFVEPSYSSDIGTMDWMVQQSILTYNNAFRAFKEKECAQPNLEKSILITENGWHFKK